MPIFEYVCRSCGAKCNLDRLPREGAKMRHLVEGKVCGVFSRNWKSVNFNRENLRSR